MGAPSARVYELARHWVNWGHDVTVLTGFPNHPTGEIHAEYREKIRKLVFFEKIQGIKVIRTWLYPLPNRRSYERILNYSSFLFSASLTGSFIKKPDVIIASSPPLFVGLIGYWLGLIKRVPLIFEVRDLWPESIVQTGMLNTNSLPINFLDKLANFLYKRCTSIAVVTEEFKNELVRKRNILPHKIAIVENGVEVDLFRPYSNSEDGVRRRLGLGGKYVVSYIGTVGVAHGLDTVLRVASILKNEISNLVFLIVGEGAERENLVRAKLDNNLNNVIFINERPKEEIPSLINASDVCLVLLRKTEVFKTVLPSKMLEFMACGKPIVLGVDGQARKILEEANGGIYIEPEDVGALRESLQKFYEDPFLRKKLGDNGRSYILENFRRERKAHQYLNLLEELRRHG